MTGTLWKAFGLRNLVHVSTKRDFSATHSFLWSPACLCVPPRRVWALADFPPFLHAPPSSTAAFLPHPIRSTRTRAHSNAGVAHAVAALAFLPLFLSHMASPAQKCDLSREEAKDELNVKYSDFCPLCKKLGAEVEVGFHKSRAAAPAAAAAGPWTRTACAH
jgi:hypothetical protein